MVAVVLAAGRVFGSWSVDAAGILAAFIAAGTAWVAVKQFSPLASAYSVATKELAVQASKLEMVAEPEWSLFVADAEEAISRSIQLGSPRVRKVSTTVVKVIPRSCS